MTSFADAPEDERPDQPSTESAPEARAPLPDELERLRRDLAEEKDRALRLRADFENFRRRTARENGASHLRGRREALLPLLDVVDTLERALAAGSSDADFYEGVVGTHRLLMNALREAGAEPLDAAGRPFDPRQHEVVATEPALGLEPNTVVRETRRGWRLGGDLLRPAQVVIAAPAEVEGESWP
jgi:molecular chaperone GrpE